MNFLPHSPSVLQRTNTDTFIEFFKKINLLYFEMVKEEKGLAKERHHLIIMNIFKGQDNDILKYLCSGKNCEVVIVLHNSTKKKKTIRY